MPPLETLDRSTPMVLWEAIGVGPTGRPIVSPTPVDIQVKVKDSQVRQLDAKGNEIALDGMAFADRLIPIGSILWKGTTDDIAGTGSAAYPPSGLLEVKMSSSIDDLKGRNVAYNVGWLRYNSRMPWSWDA